MSNFFEVEQIGCFTPDNTYRFTYNDKVRIVKVVRVLCGDNRKKGGNEDYLHCSVIAEDDVAVSKETFKNFTIAKIQGEAVKVD